MSAVTEKTEQPRSMQLHIQFRNPAVARWLEEKAEEDRRSKTATVELILEQQMRQERECR